MTLQVIFLVSALALTLILFTKMRALRGGDPILLKLISMGDERMRQLSHLVAHLYAEGKERASFFVQKQMPLHSKNLFYKSISILREKGKILGNDLLKSRLFFLIESRLFKKKDRGISEYFKNISEKENGKEDTAKLDIESPKENL